MIDHVSIGVRDIARSKRFYDAAPAPLGYRCLSQGEALLGYGPGQDNIALWVMAAKRPVPLDERSGLYFCFAAPDREAVDAFHRAALVAGGRDNGAPGLRTEYSPGYYAAFAIDPDGYRIEAHSSLAES